jgi:hypothetical protein
MADSKKMTAFRLEEALLKRLDKYAERLSKETGLPASRADVVRLLLLRALDAVEEEKGNAAPITCTRDNRSFRLGSQGPPQPGLRSLTCRRRP